ncbi:hypothetical protein CAEBREN_17384 [Caenorhabditis brenneri]|uniref:Uncharacterized protein n=1 Tax=Caenorhabditis brenneri TaxID=135651 RepID=G0N473_CAEBE|nr:hypothetical protein CAEBREN_17384 [Caenorhabditis brenneri]
MRRYIRSTHVLFSKVVFFQFGKR